MHISIVLLITPQTDQINLVLIYISTLERLESENPRTSLFYFINVFQIEWSQSNRKAPFCYLLFLIILRIFTVWKEVLNMFEELTIEEANELLEMISKFQIFEYEY